MPNRHLRFTRIFPPRRDRVRDVLVEIEDAVFGGGERGQIPEGFRAAVNSLRRIAEARPGILLEQRLSILDDEKGSPAMGRRIFRGLPHRCGIEIAAGAGRRRGRGSKGRVISRDTNIAPSAVVRQSFSSPHRLLPDLRCPLDRLLSR